MVSLEGALGLLHSILKVPETQTENTYVSNVYKHL